MLRKTDAKKVAGVYRRFLEQYPSFADLSDATSDELEQALRPLGLYRRRAFELMQLAQVVIRKYHGKTPHLRRQLIDLPGVGDYIANAVLCFAFGEDLPLLDTNIIRVVTRVFSFKPAKRRARDDPLMWRAARKIMPKGMARNFNLAMLDLAATICTPRNPHCPMCPVLSVCDYYGARGSVA